jgi:hypothetical protein
VRDGVHDPHDLDSGNLRLGLALFGLFLLLLVATVIVAFVYLALD